MSEDNQRAYLCLANKYSQDPSTWSQYSRDFMKSRTPTIQKIKLTSITEETATKVWQILETNSFHNGVFLKMSRFNHSCRANAEFFWNKVTGTRDVRAVRKIQKDKEICLNYRKLGTLTREERRGYLRDYHHFICDCEACQVTEQEVNDPSDGRMFIRIFINLHL